MTTYIGFEERDVILVEWGRVLLLEQVVRNVRHVEESSPEHCGDDDGATLEAIGAC
jgi:hypothetical protein